MPRKKQVGIRRVRVAVVSRRGRATYEGRSGKPSERTAAAAIAPTPKRPANSIAHVPGSGMEPFGAASSEALVFIPTTRTLRATPGAGSRCVAALGWAPGTGAVKSCAVVDNHGKIGVGESTGTRVRRVPGQLGIEPVGVAGCNVRRQDRRAAQRLRSEAGMAIPADWIAGTWLQDNCGLTALANIFSARRQLLHTSLRAGDAAVWGRCGAVHTVASAGPAIVPSARPTANRIRPLFVMAFFFFFSTAGLVTNRP